MSVLDSVRSVESLIRCVVEELWKQISLFVKHSRWLWDLPQKSIFR